MEWIKEITEMSWNMTCSTWVLLTDFKIREKLIHKTSPKAAKDDAKPSLSLAMDST